jgi:hypothetical protein
LQFFGHEILIFSHKLRNYLGRYCFETCITKYIRQGNIRLFSETYWIPNLAIWLNCNHCLGYLWVLSSISNESMCFNQWHITMSVQNTLLKTTIVATLWNNLSCKLKVMAQFLYILYITVNVVTCAKQKSMYSHVSTLTFDQHQFHKFFCLVKLLICKSQCSHMWVHWFWPASVSQVFLWNC